MPTTVQSDIPTPDWVGKDSGSGDDVPAAPWVTAPGGKAPPPAPRVEKKASFLDGLDDNQAAKDFGISSKVVKDVLSIGDLVASIPGAVMASGEDAMVRVGRFFEGQSHKEGSEAGVKALHATADVLGNPLHKLASWAGMGGDEGEEGGVDRVNKNLTSLIREGGDKVEEKTHGLVNADDVESLTAAAMALAGGKGLAVGVGKLLARSPKILSDVGMRTPEAEARAQSDAARDSDDLQAPTKMAEARAQSATGAKSKLVEPKNFILDPVTGELSETAPEMGKTIPKETTEERALGKVASGRSFDMTAEERIAYQGFKNRAPEKPIVDEAGNILDPVKYSERTGAKSSRFGGGQRGSIDPDMLGIGLILKGIEKLSTLQLGKVDPTTTLGTLLDNSKYTLKTLERLPQDKNSFAKAHIEQELKRADVTEVEKATMVAAMKDIPGDKVTAKDLLLGVRKATGDFELTPKRTDDFADYGIGNLGRETGETSQWEAEDGTPNAPAVPSTTTLYRLPEGVEVGDNNHFSDRRLFGWTRSFQEDGVRHVVEIQSDLAQRAGKVLTPEERKGLEESVDNVSKEMAIMDRHSGMYYKNSGWVANTTDMVNELEKHNPDVKFVLGDRLHRLIGNTLFTETFGDVHGDEAFEAVMEKAKTSVDIRQKVNDATVTYKGKLNTLLAEHDSKLSESSGLDKVAPILKNWPKRLIREELGEAREGFDGRTAEVAQHEEGPEGPYGEHAREYAENLRKQQEQPPADFVRFATADTVAKVEGWPRPLREARDRLQTRIEQLANMKAVIVDYAARGETPPTKNVTTIPVIEKYIEQEQALVDRLKGQEFRPEHQSIYDRYKRDIEKFLRQLGGKDHIDAHGHTWIEVPTPRRGGRRQMYGSVDPRMLSRLAAMGLGAWAGMYFSDHNDVGSMVKSGLLGALGAGMLAKSHPISFAKAAIKMLGREGPRFSIADPARDFDTYKRTWTIDTHLLQNKLDALLPKLADRTAVLHAREAGNLSKLSPKQLAFAKLLDNAFDERLFEGIDNDVLKSAADNYVTHMWDWSGNNKTALQKFFASHGVGMSSSTPYAKARTIPTYADGIAAGLKPISLDPTYIVGAYSNSLFNAIATKNLIGALKSRNIPSFRGNLQLLMPADKAPREYVSINHPSLRGMMVHPDVEGQMKLLFDTSPAGDWMKAATLVSDTAKHMGVSLSLFHAKSLVEAAMRATNPGVLLKVPGMLSGSNDFLQELRRGSSSLLIKDAIADGVMFSVRGVGSEDGGSGFYTAMQGAQKALDSLIPHAGAPIRGLEALSKHIDELLWQRLHPALKLFVYDAKRSALLSNSIQAARKGGPSLSREEAGRIAASFTNDLLGSLNYPRISMEAISRFGRMASESAFTPAGRRGMQVGFFSPDWNISAIRMVANAFRPEGRAMGILSPKTLADLHRNLVLRSALYYFVAFNILNYAMSGHSIWQNKDWTKIDMDAKGERHLQIDKGMMEVPNMARQPRQEFLNKLGFVPSEIANQTFDTEYLSPRLDKRTNKQLAGPPMKENRAAHAVGRFLPFAARQSPTKNPAEEIATRAGIVQITGSTPASRAAAKKEEGERRKRLKEEK